MHDPADNKAGGDGAVESKPESQLNEELDDERTQVVWTPRASARPARSRKSIVPIAAAAAVVIAGLFITSALLLLRSRPAVAPTSTKEDPLALYQVASELHEQGEHHAALKMLERAREVTKHSRAHRQLDQLAKEIQDALAGRSESPETSPEKHERGTGPRATSRAPLAASQGGASATRSRAKTPRGTNARSSQSLVYVESDAVGDILVDGRPTGKRTPATLTLRPGRHKIEVIPLIDPRERMTRSVNVPRGRATRVQLRLAGEPKKPVTTPARTLVGGDRPTRSPTIGTIGSRKPAIGLVGDSRSKGPLGPGDSKPKIGIVQTE